MPILRKIIKLGKSRAVILPKSWLELCEKKTGQMITHVVIEVDRDLRIKPYVPHATKRTLAGGKLHKKEL